MTHHNLHSSTPVRTTFLWLFFTFACASASSLAGELALASPFTDHMVLQRDTPVPVWGKAPSGETVTLSFAGQTVTATADPKGRWKTVLKPLAGTPKGRPFTAASGDARVTFADVVVGDVWICSGQSNMGFSRRGVKELNGLSAEGIRTFKVKNTVAYTEQDDLEGTWKIEGPDSAVAFGFAHHLAGHIDGEFPVGILLTAWGSSSIEAWMPRDMVATVPHFKTVIDDLDANDEARRQVEAALSKKSWSRNEDVFMRRQANILYNAMLAPLAPFACQGLIWYQGERNERYMSGMPAEPWYHRVGSIEDYDDTLKAWVQRLRKEWQREGMKFYIVMLPGFETVLATSPTRDPKHPAAHTRAWMRESQLAVLDLPHTRVANTIDLGDPKNNHPRDKAPIGERLARLAAGDCLDAPIQSLGPVLDRVEADDGRLVVHFAHADGLTTTNDQPPTEFWIAGADKTWTPATAAIEEHTVVLHAKKCPAPRHVRYAFTGMPAVNLVNAAGLPAYPFRSDEWK